MYEVNRLLLEHFNNDKIIKKLIDESYRKQDKGFYVYAKKDLNKDDDGYSGITNSKNIQGCVSYMMRYASRPAMAQSRITYYNKDSDDITWYYEDHATNEKVEVKESGLELLQKMIIHIPDKGFRMVRYYGFYHPKYQELLDEIHKLLGKEKKVYRDKEARKKQLKQKLDKLRFRTQMADTYNKDIFRCECGNTFYYVYTYNPLQGVRNDRQYRKESIDEMRNMRLSRGSPGVYA